MKKTNAGFAYKKYKRKYYKAAVLAAKCFYGLKLKKMKRLRYRLLRNMFFHQFVPPSVLSNKSDLVFDF